MPRFEKTENLIDEITQALGFKKFSEIASFANDKLPYWGAVKNEMQPHIWGEMPPAISKAFPQEGAITHKYRLDIYNSRTAPALAKAVTNVKAHVIERIDFEAAPRVLEYLNNLRFRERNFKHFIKEFFYPMRVADPNAIIAIKQHIVPDSEKSNDPVLELVMHPSEDIVVKTDDFIIVKMAKINDKVSATYYFYGRFKQAVINLLQNGEVEIVASQDNDNGVVPVCFLGGSTLTKEITANGNYLGYGYSATKKQITYYVSDFSYAIPLMNDCEKARNQAEVSSVKTTIPITIQREIVCGTCNGKGTVYKTDENGDAVYNSNGDLAEKICPTCNGKKHALPTQTNDIIVPHSQDIHGDLNLQLDIATNVVAYATPPVENSRYADERAKAAEQIVQDALNITGVNMNFAVSAESKKEARSEKETQLKEIANSIARVYHFLLTNFSLFLSGYGRLNLRQSYVETVKITIPTQFITISADELETEYLAQRPNLSLGERDAKQRQIYKNKQPANTEKIDLYFNVAWIATNGFWLYSPLELQDITLLGTLTQEDKIRATKAANYLYKLVFVDNETNAETLITKVDEFIANELRKTGLVDLTANNNLP